MHNNDLAELSTLKTHTYSNANIDIVAKRKNNVVTLDFSTTAAISLAHGSWQTIGTLGSDYLPVSGVYSTVFCDNNYQVIGAVRVAPNGDVAVYNETTNIVNLRGHVSFISA